MRAIEAREARPGQEGPGLPAKKGLSTGGFVSTGGIAASSVVALGGAVLLGRILAPEDRGEFATYIVTSVLLAMALEIGGDIGVVRAYAELTTEKASAYCIRYAVSVVAFGLGIAVVMPMLGPILFQTCPARTTWMLSGLSVAAALASRLQTGQLLAEGAYWQLAGMRILSAVTGTGGVIAASATAVGVVQAPRAASGVFLWQGALAVTFLVLSIRRAGGRTGLSKALTRDRLIWTGANLRLHALNLSTYSLSRGDQLALSLAGHSRILGIYAVAVNLAEVVGYVPAALSPILAGGAHEERPSKRTWWAILALLVGATVVLVLAAGPLIRFLFGEMYRESVAVAWMLLPASAVFALSRMIQAVLLKDHAGRFPLAIVAMLASGVQFGLVLNLGGRGSTWTAASCVAAYTIFLLLTCLLYVSGGRCRKRMTWNEARSS